MRIPTPDLTRKALLALEEIAQTHGGSFPRNMALRFILAYLYSVSNSPRDREPFDEFWRGSAYNHPHSKEMNAIYHVQERTRVMNGIYNAVGHRRR